MTAAAPEQSELLTGSVAASRAAPAEPYRGLEPFRFADAGILAARDAEIERLVRLVTMYRGVLLYGESGAGKSSVVNAGLLPRLVEEGMWPHRVRVQPRPDGELVLEPIRSSATDPNVTLPSAFENIGADGRLVLSAQTFADAVTQAATHGRIVLVFDQFEEIVTLFDATAGGTDLQTAVVDAIGGLLRDRALPVKLLFVFREDYLANLEPLLARHPELADQSVRLVPPPTSDGESIIRAPFARFAGAYRRELSDELAGRISASLAERSENGRLNLSELQIVCSRLWHAEDPADLLASRGVEGILEDFLDQAVATFDGPARDLAVVILTRLVTSSGTRNVVSRDDLIADACEESGCEQEEVNKTLDRLAGEAGLVRAEHRRDVRTYEIVSEFLVPKITMLKAERAAAAESQRVLAAAAAAHEQERAERRRARLRAGIVVAAGVTLLVAALAGYAWHQRGSAISSLSAAQANEIANSASTHAASDPGLADTLALNALHRRWVPAAENALRVALATAHPVRTFGDAATAQSGSCCVALSPDFQYAAATTGKSTRIWSIATGKQVLDIASAGFGGVASTGAPPVFSTHHTVFVNGPKHALREYSVPSGKLVRSYRGHTKEAYSVVLSPDGSRLASPGADGFVYIWKSNGQSAGDVYSHARTAFDETGFSSDSRELITLKHGGLVEAWRLPGGQQPWYADNVLSLATSPQGNMVATVLWSGALVLRDAATGKVRARVRDPKLALYGAVFDRTGRFVAARVKAAPAKDFRSIAIWSVPAGHRVRTIAVGQFPYDFALSPNGRLLAAAVRSGAEIWDVSTGTRIARLSLGKQAGWNVAFSADGSHLVTGGGDGQVRVWDLPAFLPHNVFPTGARAAWSTAFSPSGDRVAAGGQDGRLTIWSVPDGRRLVHVTVSRKPLHMVAFDPHGQSVAVATGSGKDAVLDASSGKRLYTVAAGGDSGSVAFSPDGTKLLTSGYLRRGESVRVWDAATGAREFAKPAPFVQDAVFSPDGGQVAAGGDDGLVRIWRIDNGALVRQLRPGTARHEHVNAVAYSNDGNFLAAGTSAGVVVIWDAHTGSKLATLRGHSNWVDALQFTADGRHLISASDDGTVRLWDWRPNTGATVVSGIDSGTSLGFTDHGSWVSVAMPNKTVYLVHCFACQPLATLEALAAQQARPLSASEERTYLHTGESLSSRPY